MTPMAGGLTIAIIIILVLVIGLGLWLVGAYNGLVRLRNQVQESWNQVDVELQRRHDLIPNLVATVKGIAGHERNTLEEVVRLRNAAAGMDRPGALPSPERAQVEEQLTQAVSRMMVTVEAYPELKSSQNFLELQRALTETEDRIAAGRRFFNANVRAYNTKIESFPTNLIAGMGKFEKANYFEVRDAETRQSQTIDFDSISSVGPTQSQLDAQRAGQGAIPAQTYQQAYPSSNAPGQQGPFSGEQPAAGSVAAGSTAALGQDTLEAPAAEAYASAPAQASNHTQPQSGYPVGAQEYAEPVSGNIPQVEGVPGYQMPREPSLQPGTATPAPQNPTMPQQY